MHENLDKCEPPKEERKFTKLRNIVQEILYDLENTVSTLENAFSPVLSCQVPNNIKEDEQKEESSEIENFISNTAYRLYYLNNKIKSICDRSEV